jgi:hypothetical protein
MRRLLAWWARRSGSTRPALHRWCHPQYTVPCDPMTKLDLANLDNGVAPAPREKGRGNGRANDHGREARDAVTVFVDGYGI